MKRFLILLVVLLASLALSGSCVLDPKEEGGGGGGGGGDDWADLKAKDDVLHNFELAYNNRDINQYKKLTDEDETVFIFVFSREDFNSGKTPDQWERAKEVEVTGRMFQRGGSDPIQSMNMNFSYAEGDIAWEEATPPEGHEQEKWYQKIVTYDFTVETTSGQTYYAVDSQALFIVRYNFNSVAEDSVWQVVQYYDLGPAE